MTGKGTKATAPRIGYGAIPLLAIVVGCTGNQTTASRSAAAYDEARRKGIPIETHGGEHDGHGAAKPAHDAADVPGMDHHAAPEERAEGAAAHQRHGAHDGPQVQGPPSHGEHTATPRTKRDMSGEAHAGHAEATGAHPPAEGVDHSGMAGMAMAPPRPEPKLAAAEPGDPAATLQPDDMDRPAPTSLEEAARSQAMNAGMAAGGHGMSHDTYKHTDAGREGAASPEGGGHQHHQTPEPRPSPSPGQQRPQQHEHGSAQQPGRVPPSPPGPQPW